MKTTPEQIERIERPDGCSLEARVYNPEARRTLMLSNGLGCPETLFRYLIDDLATDHRLVTWDYRGHGRSTEAAGAGAYTLSAHAADLAAVQQAVAAVTAVHLGFGLGALVALEHHSWSPESVEALVLIQGGLPRAGGRLPLASALTGRLLTALTPLTPWGAALLLRRGGPGGVRGAFQAAQRLGLVGRTLSVGDFEEMVAAASSGHGAALREISRALKDTKPVDALDGVKAPTLVFGAARDPVFPEALVRQVHESLHNSEYVRLPGAGRAALLELGPVIAARVRRFLSERRQQTPWKDDSGDESLADPVRR